MKKKLKITKVNPVVAISTVVIIAAIITILLMQDGKNISPAEVLALATAIIGVISLGNEMRRGKNLAEAEFLVNLNSTFADNDDYRKAYCMFDSYDFKSKPDLDLTNSVISNYLTFFETFYLLIKRNIIEIDMIDDLFGYRFFIAVHNPYVQKVKLLKSPCNFKNIYRLEKLWQEYRLSKGLEIFGYDCRLEIRYEEIYGNIEDYRNLLNDKG